MKNQDKKIERCNLTRQVNALLPQYIEEVTNIFQSGKYVLGHKLQMFERTFAQYVGTTYGVGVASGTDALYLSLRVLDIGMGDEVITTPFTAVPTISAIIMTGAKPIFADVDPDTFTIAPESIEKVITKHTKAIIPVHLYGLMADMNAIMNIGNRYSIPIIEDAAQAHGSSLNDRQAGSIGLMGCFSFYPTKNLGALGDGGAVATNNASLADTVARLRQYGWSAKYEVTLGHASNSRLDELQAAILRGFLPLLDGWNERRRKIAELYATLISHPNIKLPEFNAEEYVGHLYVIKTENPAALREHLKAKDIASEVHYPIPDYRQPVFKNVYADISLANTEALAKSILTLPCYPELTDEQVLQIAEAVNSWQA